MSARDASGAEGSSDDRALAVAAAAGDRDAFARLVGLYQNVVAAICWRMTYDRHLAADITQDVFVHLWGRLDRYDAERPFRPWFLRLATNAAINAIKKRRNKARERSLDSLGRGPGADADDRRLELPDETAADPADDAAGAEVRAALRAAVRELSPTYAAVVALHYLEGKTVNEVSELLGIPSGTVKIRLFRARAILKEKLARWEERP